MNTTEGVIVKKTQKDYSLILLLFISVINKRLYSGRFAGSQTLLAGILAT